MADSKKKTTLPKTKDVVHSSFCTLKEYSKLAGSIPTEDYDYHMAFPGFKKRIATQSQLLLDLMDAACQMVPEKRRIPFHRDNMSSTSSMVTVTDEQRLALMESLDSILENVDMVLDEAAGKKMSAAEQLLVTFGSQLTPGTATNQGEVGAGTTSGGKVDATADFPSIIRPQLTFSKPVDNSTKPFIPVYYDSKGKFQTGKPGVHPFRELITRFSPQADQLMPKMEVPFVPLETCPLRFVDNEDDLKKVVKDILNEKEVAVDLEHHDTYSYQGFTCLMQISTRTEDIIIDCLKLRSVMHLLSPVFINKNILKVFHGAREDVKWLQKDFGLYLLNFFDTSIALQTLHMPFSLYFAVDHFCQVKLDKRYQTADWRIRPIPAEMVHYARQDTHYLLYCYDRLKALLLNSQGRASIGNLLLYVYEESKQLSLSLYEKPELIPESSYKKFLGRSLGGLSPTQERVAREIFNWRDKAAREVDDSPGAVLHLSSVLSIASKLPTSAKELLRCCTPISASVRKDVAHLVEIVRSELGEEKEHLSRAKLKAKNSESLSKNKESAVFYSRRPLGIYRPMSGSLPSISSRVNFPNTAEISPEERKKILLDVKPSLWFQSMVQISNILATKAPYRVAIPGSEVADSRNLFLLAKSQNAAKQAAGDLLENNTRVKHDEDDDEDKERGGDSHHQDGNAFDSNEFGSETIKLQGEGTGKPQISSPIPSEAFSLRQRYGKGGSKKRKRDGE